MMAPTIAVSVFLLCTIVAMMIVPSAAFDFSLAETNNDNQYQPAYAAAKEPELQTEIQPQSEKYRNMLSRVQNSLRVIYKGKGKSYADFVSNPLWQQDGPVATPEEARCPPFLVGQVEGC
jgi:hypothetical protein